MPFLQSFDVYVSLAGTADSLNQIIDSKSTLSAMSNTGDVVATIASFADPVTAIIVGEGAMATNVAKLIVDISSPGPVSATEISGDVLSAIGNLGVVIGALATTTLLSNAVLVAAVGSTAVGVALNNSTVLGHELT